MPSSDTEAKAVAQWNGHLDEIAAHTAEHLADCKKPGMCCPGVLVVGLLSVLQPWEIKTLLEFALVRIVNLQQGNKNMTANAEVLAEEVLFANALPAHWCRECEARHA